MTERESNASSSYGGRLRELAKLQPDVPAIRMVEDGIESGTMTYADLDRAADVLAHRMKALGCDDRSMIVIALPNCIPFVIAMFATWRIGACPIPLKYDQTPIERQELLELIQPAVIISEDREKSDRDISASEIEAILREGQTAEPLPEVTPQRCWGIASGGSTGRPKIILNCRPASMKWQFVKVGTQRGDRHVQLICLPLYHTSALSMCVKSLLDGDTIIMLPRFEADAVVDAIERYRVTLLGLVATITLRLIKLPNLDPARLKSLQLVITGGGAIADEVLRGWAAIVGAQNIVVGFGASEALGSVSITGDELLKRPGTVGKPATCEVAILNDDGLPVRQGEVGEIFFRSHSGDSQRFDYLGGETPRKRPDGFASVGDLGWLDEDGYLYISDRRTDMVKTGGVNVFPAEVEAALHGMPEVADCVVIGLPDVDWGRRLHAIIVAVDPGQPPRPDAIRDYLRQRLAPPKIPKSYEFVAALGRGETMKLNRRALAEARIANAVA